MLIQDLRVIRRRLTEVSAPPAVASGDGVAGVVAFRVSSAARRIVTYPCNDISAPVARV
jgi:hypothetical protein